MADPGMTGPLQGNLGGTHLRAEMKDPANWPAPMRAEWGNDQGLAVAQKARQRQIEQFHKLRAELDAFRSDFILIVSKDSGESLRNFAIPQYWIQAHEKADVKIVSGPGGRVAGQTFFPGENVERVFTVKGHPEGAKHLVRGLQQTGFDPTYSLEPMHPAGFAHTFCGVTCHLDWEKREFATPVVPISLDPFGPRQRGADGCSPIKPGDPLPISAPRAFALGQTIARILRPSPWRVALVAGVGWSHANNTSWERSWVHPDIPGDQRRYDELKENKFTAWHNFTNEEFEEHGQWELLCWIVLAGAMTEVGARVKWSDFQANWLFNSNWVNCAFTVA
jgi:hypothetical protein